MPSYSPSPDLCISCIHVVYDKDPINCVSYSGGDWVLFCGRRHHYSDDPTVSKDEEELVTIHLHHLVERQPELLDIIEKLDVDYTAERKDAGSEWVIYHDPDEY